MVLDVGKVCGIMATVLRILHYDKPGHDTHTKVYNWLDSRLPVAMAALACCSLYVVCVRRLECKTCTVPHPRTIDRDRKWPDVMAIVLLHI